MTSCCKSLTKWRLFSGRSQAHEEAGPLKLARAGEGIPGSHDGPPTAPVEALLREQVAKGHFPSLDRALEAARWMRLRWVDQYLFRRLLRLHKLTRKLFIIF